MRFRLHARNRPSLPALRAPAAWVALACFVVLSAHRAEPAAAHPHMIPPPIQVTVMLEDNELRVGMSIDEPLLRSKIDWPASQSEPTFDQAKEWLNKAVRVEVDGKPFPMEMSKVAKLLSMGGLNALGEPIVPSLLLRAKQSVDGVPRRIRVVWNDFDGMLWENEVVVPMDVFSPGAMDGAQLRPDEPEYTWHSEQHPPRERAAIVAVEAKPPEQMNVPAAAIAVTLLGLLMAGLFMRSAPGAVRWRTLAACCIAGAVLWQSNIGAVSMERPGSGTNILPGTDTEARAIFDQLLRNVYGAFDASSEDEIYDQLAISVEPAILQDVYLEVFEALVLREEGGAVCHVEELTIEAAEVLLPEDDWVRHFDVKAAWTLAVAIQHYGHGHRRLNHYEATIRVHHAGDIWRIQNVNTTKKVAELVDDDGNLIDAQGNVIDALGNVIRKAPKPGAAAQGEREVPSAGATPSGS